MSNTVKIMRDNNLWDNIKCTNIHIIGVPEKREKGPKKIFEEITFENFPNMGKEIATQGSTEIPRQDKAKKKHTKTHSN